MKKKLLYILTILLFVLIPKPIFAQEEITPTDETQVDCIDLEAIYEEINNSSQAITGTKNSIDAVKKINTTASLMNILSVFLGDQIYCVKDEVAASKSTTLKTQGLLGMVDNANTAIFSMYPDINVGDHLAQRFIPGYGDNNSLLAQSDGYQGVPGNEWWKKEKGGEGEEEKANKLVEFIKTKILGLPEEFIDETEGLVEIEEPEEEVETNSSGYNYLKDTIQLDKIWSHSLNIVYVLYVLIFIIVGFMIMFRKKLQGNVTVTFSRALPNLIISLILATFSFAIVGFVMDVGRITMNISRTVFEDIYEPIDLNPYQDPKLEVIEYKNVWVLADNIYKVAREDTFIDNTIGNIPIVGKPLLGLMTGTGNTIGGEIARGGLFGLIYLYLDKTMPEIVNSINVDKAADLEVGVGFSAEILQPILHWIQFAAKNTVYILKTGAQYAILGQLIKSLIIIVISFYAAFKLFIALLTSYLKLFGNVILAPFQMLMGAIPGNTNQITNWFKSVVANTLVFPAIFILINGFTLISQSINDPSKFNFFSNGGVLWPDVIISLRSVIVIAGYLFAANMPKIINGALGVGANKSLMGAGDDMAKSVKKIPVVGGMFN